MSLNQMAIIGLILAIGVAFSLALGNIGLAVGTAVGIAMTLVIGRVRSARNAAGRR